MWRFIKGVEPPTKKKKTNEDDLETRREYEHSKRERSFQKRWQEDFPWLRFCESKNKMFCTICENSSVIEKDSLFATQGSDSFKIHTLQRHSESKSHQKAQSAKAAKESLPGTSAAARALTSLHKEQVAKLEILFRNAHAIAKNARPITDFEWMVDLDVKKGLDLGKTYTNRNACTTFINCISHCEFKSTSALVSAAPFLSLSCDETTDCSVLEQLIVFVSFANNGTTLTRFLGLVNLENTTAKSILDAIIETTKERLHLDHETLSQKLISFVSDGAAALQGSQSGVVSLLRTTNPTLIGVHCMAHRVELAIRDTIKTSSKFSEVEDTLLQLYLFYHHSPKRRSQLVALLEVKQLKNRVPTRVKGTRWITHTRQALENFFEIFDALATHLENLAAEEANSIAGVKAKSILKAVTTKSFIKSALFLRDVVEILSKLSLFLQKCNENISSTVQAIHKAIFQLESLKTNEGSYSKLYKNEDSFTNVELSGPPHQLTTHLPTIITKLVEQLKKRFPDDNNTAVKLALRVLDFKRWPTSHTEMLFGDNELSAFATEYKDKLSQCKVNVLSLGLEWTSLKVDIYSSPQPVHEMSWPDIFVKFAEDHSNILRVISMLLTIGSTSVECERAFSKLKLMQTNTRNSLRRVTMNNLMNIMLHSPSITEFDPTTSIQFFLESSSGQRKLNYQRTKGNDASESSEDSS